MKIVFLVMMLASMLAVIIYYARDRKTLWRTIPCTLIALVIYYLSQYQHASFILLFLPVVFVEVFMSLTDKKSPKLWYKYAAVTFFCFFMIGIWATDEVCHKVVVECPVTVYEGNVTVNVADISDDMLEYVEQDKELMLDIFELSNMSNGTYKKYIIINYTCFYRRHHTGKCTCNEREICKLCQGNVNRTGSYYQLSD